MTASSFRINQPPGSGYTYWDRARRDLVLGSVELEAQNKSETSYLWEIVSGVPGESIIIANSTTHTCQFDLVTRYGYLVRLTVNAGEIDESIKTLYIGVPLANSGTVLPALNETNQDNSQSPYDGSRGTEEKLSDALIKFDGGFSWDYEASGDYLHPVSATARVHVPSGDLSSPGLGFVSDVDTGVYLPSAGVLGHVASGTEMYRSYLDSSDPVIDAMGTGAFRVRNNGDPVGSSVTAHFGAKTSNGDPTGAEVYVISDAYNTQISKAHVGAESPGGTTEAKLYSSNTGVGGGTSDVIVQAIGAGTSSALVSANTSGVYQASADVEAVSTGSSASASITADGTTATVDVLSDASSGAAVTSIDAQGTTTTSFVKIGGASCRVTFNDYLRDGSGFTDPELYLAKTQTEWTDYYNAFGVTTGLLGVVAALADSSPNLQAVLDEGRSASISSNGDWLELKNSSSSLLYIGKYDDSGVYLAPGGVDGGDNNNVVITTASNRSKDHDLETLGDDPALYIFAADDVDSDNTKWISISRNDSNAYIKLGEGSGGTIYIDGTLRPDEIYNTGDTYMSDTVRLGASSANNVAGTVTMDGQRNLYYTSTSSDITTVSLTINSGQTIKWVVENTDTGTIYVSGFASGTYIDQDEGSTIPIGAGRAATFTMSQIGSYTTVDFQEYIEIA